MKCPYCNNEMREGNLCSDRHTGTKVFWKDDGEKTKLLDGLLKKGSVNVDYKIGSFYIHGYYCDVCKKIILDADVNK